jgi:hypothetical protein
VFHLASTHLGRDTQQQIHWSVDGPRGSETPTNIIKTERRNKMGDEWMNNNMLCYIERDMFVEIQDEKIFKAFSRLKNSEDKFTSQHQLMNGMCNIIVFLEFVSTFFGLHTF